MNNIKAKPNRPKKYTKVVNEVTKVLFREERS